MTNLYHGVPLKMLDYEFICNLEKFTKEPIPVKSDLKDEFYGMVIDDGHVIILKLNFRNLSELPNSLGNLSLLEELHGYRNNLETIPESIGNLKSLQFLDLRGNNLINLPESIGELESLEILKLDENNLNSLPESLGNLEDLEQLYLNGNKLETLPNSIGNLKSLEILQLNRNFLKYLPESFGKLKSLEELYLNENKLDFLPKSIGDLKRLWIFHLDRNNLKNLPISFKKLTDLEEVYLYGNKLKKVPKSIGRLKDLEKLQLEKNAISKLPKSICLLNSLEKLYLCGNIIKTLPKNIGHLKNLEVLQLDGNKISKLPKSLNSLTSLKQLFLRNNHITEYFKSLKMLEEQSCTIYLSDDLSKVGKNQFDEVELIYYHEISLYKSEYEVIKNLEKICGEIIPTTKDPDRQLFGFYTEEGYVINLNLNFKELNDLPETICQLAKLRKLILRGNKLATLPESIKKLATMKHLDISHNLFQKLPSSIWPQKNLTKFETGSNPWKNDSKLIVKNSIPAILEYCRKKANIQIFISHSVNDEDKYHIEELSQFLENQPEVYKVIYCERDLIGNIDEFMEENIPKCQLLLFLATNQSVFKSHDCKYEIKIANQHSVEILPLKSNELSWNDLEHLNLNREFGKEFNLDKFDEFCFELYEYIKEFKRKINLFEKEKAKVDKSILKIKNVILNIINSQEFKNYLTIELDMSSNKGYKFRNYLNEQTNHLTKLFKFLKNSKRIFFLD